MPIHLRLAQSGEQIRLWRWRIVIEHDKYQKEGVEKALFPNVEDGLVLGVDFKTYYIDEMTTVQFLNYWEKKCTSYIFQVSELASVLPLCGNCYGRGKVDWARNAMAGHCLPAVSPANRSPFNTSGVMEVNSNRRAAQMLPRLEEGDSYCFRCGATGIAFDVGNYQDMHDKHGETFWCHAIGERVAKWE